MYSRILWSWHWSYQEEKFRSQNINLALCRASKIVLLKSSFIPKETLLVMTRHQGILFCIHLMLVWICMVLISVNGSHTKKLHIWLCNLLVILPFWLMIFCWSPLTGFQSHWQVHQVHLQQFSTKYHCHLPTIRCLLFPFYPDYCRFGKHAVIWIKCWKNGSVLLGCGKVSENRAGNGIICVELTEVMLVFS